MSDDNDSSMSLETATLSQICTELSKRSVVTVVFYMPITEPTRLQMALVGNRYTIIGILEDVVFDLKSGAEFQKQQGDGLGG